MQIKGRGFTIIELLIVVVVIVLLATMTMLYLTRTKAKSRLTRVTRDLTTIAAALTQYAEDNNYQFPPDASRDVPPGLEKYIEGGVWPDSAWPNGVFDWDSWVINGQQVYQISYRLCGLSDPIATCRDPILFPNFERNSSIFYCISGPCIPHESTPTVPAYCVNCNPKEQNY